MIGTCVSLSWQILQLLLTAKGNKHEHKSLQSAVTNIHRFLRVVPSEGVSDEGNEVLSKWCCSCTGCWVVPFDSSSAVEPDGRIDAQKLQEAASKPCTAAVLRL
jgi:hypothetical protein